MQHATSEDGTAIAYDRTGEGPAVILVGGGSSGGALALEAAAASSAITRLAVFEPPYVTDPARPPLPSEKELSDLVQTGHRGEAVELFMTKGADVPAELVGQMKDAPFWAGMEAMAHTLAYEAAIMGTGRVPTQRLATIGTPAIVLVGTDSPARMQDASRAVADVLPTSRLHSLEGQAHGQVDPATIGVVLTSFFTT